LVNGKAKAHNAAVDVAAAVDADIAASYTAYDKTEIGSRERRQRVPSSRLSSVACVSSLALDAKRQKWNKSK